MNRSLLLLGFLLSFHLMVPALATFLEGTVDNYGDGNYSVGQVWTGLVNYESNIREATFTIQRAVSESYLDFPVEVEISFTDSSTAPIWEGLTPGGAPFSEKYQRTIKVIDMSGSVEEEIPSQISYRTQCFKTGGGAPVDCSSTDFKVNHLYLYFLYNITTDDSVEFKIIYPTIFLGAGGKPDEYYRFVYNSTTATYLQYNDTEAVYLSRIQYDQSTNYISVPEIPFTIERNSEGDISKLDVGTHSGSYMAQAGNIVDCIIPLNSNNKIFGMVMASSVNASVVLEIENIGCNLWSMGEGTGRFDLKIFPKMYYVSLITQVDDSGVVNPYIFRLAADGDVGINPNIRIWSRYINSTDNELVDHQESATLITTTYDTNFGGSGGCTAISGGSGNYCAPLAFQFKNTTSSGVYNMYGRNYDNANPNYYDSYVNTSAFINNYRWNTWFAPIILSCSQSSYCTNTEGYPNSNTFHQIIQAEDFGGYIGVDILPWDFNVPCVDTTTNYCDLITSNDLDAYPLTCGSGDLGYTDNCGDFHTCIYCTTCDDYLSTNSTLYCDSNCFDKGEINQYCDGSTKYLVRGCGTTSTICEWGCSGDECIGSNTGNFVNLTWGVWDWHQGLTAYPLSGVLVNVTGTVYGTGVAFDETCTTYTVGGSAECSMAIPRGIYQVSGNCVGVGSCQNYAPFDTSCVLYDNQEGQTGTNTWSMFNTGNNSYCSLIVSNGGSVGRQYFSILESGVSENYTILYVTTINNLEHRLEGVNVTVQINSTYSESQLTGASGQAQFSFTENDYDLGVTASKEGYETWTGETHIIRGGLAENHLIVLMINEADMSVQGSGPQNAVVGTGLFEVDDAIPIPILFDKAGSVSIRRTDVRVFKCKSSIWDIIPFVSSMLGCNEFEMLKVAVPYLPLDNNGNIVTLITYNNTDHEGSMTYATFEKLTKNGQCNYTQDSTGNPSPGKTGMIEIQCANVDCGLFSVYDNEWIIGTSIPGLCDVRTPIFDWSKQKIGIHTQGPAAPALAVGRAAVSAVQNQLEKSGHPRLGLFISNMYGMIEIGAKLVRIGLDMYTYDVIFQLDSKALIQNIPNWSETTSVIIDGQYISGTYTEILTHPKYRRYIARRDPPPVLMLDDPNLMGEDISFQSYADRTLDFDLETMTWSKDLIKRDVDTGIEYIRVKRDEIFGDVQNDLINGEYDSLKFNENLLERSVFEANAYLEVTLTPYDGSDPSTVYVLVPGYIRNYTFSWVSGGALVLLLVLIVLLGPIIISLLAIYKPRIGG